MKNWKSLKTILPVLAAMLIGHAAFAQSQPLQTNSAPSSRKSDTDVNRQMAVGRKQSADLINACAAAADDLQATRALVESLEKENAALNKQLEAEKQSVDLLNEIDATRKSETAALRETVAAKNEAIAAKDAVIASQDKLIDTLKKKRSSPWKRLGDVLIGAAVVAVLR